MKYYNETYEYKGYIIEEHYEEDDECIHHNCVVFKDGKYVEQFNWDFCVEEAKKYIDEVLL